MTGISAFFKSILQQDQALVVICDTKHTILYMNPASVVDYGGDLTGKNLRICHNDASRKKIDLVLAWFRKSREHNIVYTFRNEKENKDVYMVALRDDAGELIGYYEKHEYRSRETAALYEMGE